MSEDTAPSPKRIRRTLDRSRDPAERAAAAELLLPLLWHRLPWVRYRAACALTTRIYLPYGLHPLETFSFPLVLLRRLRKWGYRSAPEDHDKRRAALLDTLDAWLRSWIDAYFSQRSGRLPSPEICVDICEAIGRLGLYETQGRLLELLRACGTTGVWEVRTTLLVTLADLPPAHMRELWDGLRSVNLREREILASSLAYMWNAEAVPVLTQLIPYQPPEAYTTVLRPILKALGVIGDVRALPALNTIVRTAGHPEQATARTAIQRLMKQAEGKDEVSLVRASAAATLDRDALVRASDSIEAQIHPDELLRSSGMDGQCGNAPEISDGAAESSGR